MNRKTILLALIVGTVNYFQIARAQDTGETAQLTLVDMCKEAFKNPFDTMTLSERQSWAADQVAKVCNTEFHTKEQFSTSVRSGNADVGAVYGLFGISASGAISSASQDQSYDSAYKKYCKYEGSSDKYDQNFDLYSSHVSEAAGASFKTCVPMLPSIFPVNFTEWPSAAGNRI